MARRTATSYRTTRTKETVSTEGPAAEVVVTEKKGGAGIAEALAFATTFLLLAAILLTDYYLGTRYGKGIFFK